MTYNEREREKKERTTNPFRRDQLHEWQTNNDKPLRVRVLLVTNTIEIKERDVQVNWTCYSSHTYTETLKMI